MRRGITIHHNGPPARCIGRPHTRCLAYWQGVKTFHTLPPPDGQGWSDIAYSFGICPHGERFTGRGWNKNQFANGSDQVGTNNGPDSEWYSVLAFVGGDTSTRDEELPTDAMVDATAALIAEARATGRAGAAVKPHSDWKPKPCPGPTFTRLARQWDGQPLHNEEDEMLTTDQDRLLREIHVAVFGGKTNEIARQTWALRVDNFETQNGSAADLLRQIRASTGDLDDIAAVVAPILVDALIEELPDDIAAHITQGVVEAGVLAALGKVTASFDTRPTT